jgi:hypothetical protein
LVYKVIYLSAGPWVRDLLNFYPTTGDGTFVRPSIAAVVPLDPKLLRKPANMKAQIAGTTLPVFQVGLELGEKTISELGQFSGCRRIANPKSRR